MVVDFQDLFLTSIWVPAVEAKFPFSGAAAFANDEGSVFKFFGGYTDSVQNAVICFTNGQADSSECLNKAGGGRVHHHQVQGSAGGQAQEVVDIFAVGFLSALGSGVEEVLSGAKPDAVAAAPQAEGSGVNGTVIAGDAPAIAGIGRVSHKAAIEEGVNQALRGAPLAQDEAPVEVTMEQAVIAQFCLGIQGGVIVHREVEIEEMFFGGFLDPFLEEPVGGAFGVAGQPDLAAWHRASGAGLFDKRPRHKGGLIEEDAGEGDPLNQGRAAFVTAAIEEEGILDTAEAESNQVFIGLTVHKEAEFRQSGQHLGEQISFNAGEGSAAEGELSVAEPSHSPAKEAEAEAKRFATAHGAVAEDSVQVVEGGRIGPPTEGNFLFL